MRASFAVVAFVAALGLNFSAYAREAALDKKASLEIGNKLIDQSTKQFLQEFKADPVKAIQKKKVKFNADGTQIALDAQIAGSKFNRLRGSGQLAQGVKTDEAFIAKGKEKFLSNICVGDVGGEHQCLSSEGGRRGIVSNDEARNLVDNGFSSYVDNIYTMANQGLTRGQVAVQPWSSDYWAIASGVLAKRYTDPSWPNLNWHALNGYWSSNPPYVGMDQLSPAEKYDILVGDANFTLTRASLNQGAQYGAGGRPVETWMGICHGWAPAAYMDARPVRAVVAYAPDGTAVTFRPDDIKALSVLKWANGKAVRNQGGRLQYSSRFIGGRCNLKNDSITRDPNTGAIINDECFDTNPGTWHKAMVNQIGMLKKSFVLDATFDYEVWNQPLSGYSYTYFNPETMTPVATLGEGMKAIGSFGDRFSSTRMNKYAGTGKSPTHVVGVIMQAAYIVETGPTAAMSDHPGRDAVRNVRYVYDLELGANGEIIGGEWYEDGHPDFLWTPAEGSFAYNEIDANVTSWSPTSRPANLTQVARQASASSIPLKAVVDGLIQAAQ